MASGDRMATWDGNSGAPPPTATVSGTLNTRGTRAIPIIAFDGDGNEDQHWEFPINLPQNYGGGGITVRGKYWMATATTGNVRLGVAIERHQDGTGDVDTESFAAYQEATEAVPGTSGVAGYFEINLSNGAQMDSLAANEGGRLRFRREASDTTNDTAAGLFELEQLWADEQ